MNLYIYYPYNFCPIIFISINKKSNYTYYIMCILSKILIKNFILICNIFTICFVLYSKQLLANNNSKSENQRLTLQIIQLVEEKKFNKVKN